MPALKTMLLGSLIAATAGGLANASTLALKPGEYVRSGAKCADAPFAALVTFDGQNFSGPHAAGCATVVLKQTGRHYRLQTTCVANGDGSRASVDGSPSTPYTERESISVLSSTRMVFAHPTGAGAWDWANYRRCRSLDAA